MANFTCANYVSIRLLLKSKYLLLLTLFLLLLSWISTIVYLQLGELITKPFPSMKCAPRDPA
jgi:ATP/ADP translocase